MTSSTSGFQSQSSPKGQVLREALGKVLERPNVKSICKYMYKAVISWYETSATSFFFFYQSLLPLLNSSSSYSSLPQSSQVQTVK